MDESQQSSCAVELPADDTPPAWIQLPPGGDLRARDGRRWHLGNLANVIAAGRIRTLAVRDVAIWGQVEWSRRISWLGLLP